MDSTGKSAVCQPFRDLNMFYKNKIKHKWITIAALAVVFLGVGQGCTLKSDSQEPVGVLKSYISASFQAKNPEDKGKMEAFLTGETLRRLTAWSPEQFSRAFIETPRRFKSLTILENKPVGETTTTITYELAYQEGSPGKETRITQKKLAEVVLEAGAWKIREVKNLRESIDYLGEFTLP